MVKTAAISAVITASQYYTSK